MKNKKKRKKEQTKPQREVVSPKRIKKMIFFQKTKVAINREAIEANKTDFDHPEKREENKGPPRRLKKTFFLRKVLRNREVIEAKKSNFEHMRKRKKKKEKEKEKKQKKEQKDKNKQRREKEKRPQRGTSQYG